MKGLDNIAIRPAPKELITENIIGTNRKSSPLTTENTLPNIPPIFLIRFIRGAKPDNALAIVLMKLKPFIAFLTFVIRLPTLPKTEANLLSANTPAVISTANFTNSGFSSANSATLFITHVKACKR